MSERHDRGVTVNLGSPLSHQLLGVSGSIPGPKILRGKEDGPGCGPQNGQHHSLDIYQPDGGSPLALAMLPSNGDMELVPREKHLGKSRSVPSR